MLKYLIIFLVVLVVISAAGLFFLIKGKPEYKTVKVEINGKVFEVEVADTIFKQIKGLSGRKTLGEDKGMLFVYTTPGKYHFWMVGMKFSLDIVWINGNKIIDISKNVLAPEKGKLPAIVSPMAETDKILEIPAGSAEKFNIKVGDAVIIN